MRATAVILVARLRGHDASVNLLNLSFFQKTESNRI